ncbi:hypothetical protein FWH30_02100 [Microgenomates group bacterium]|nr:hypothetical protein [Microgenomates group bacterium]
MDVKEVFGALAVDGMCIINRNELLSFVNDVLGGKEGAVTQLMSLVNQAPMAVELMAPLVDLYQREANEQNKLSAMSARVENMEKLLTQMSDKAEQVSDARGDSAVVLEKLTELGADMAKLAKERTPTAATELDLDARLTTVDTEVSRLSAGILKLMDLLEESQQTSDADAQARHARILEELTTVSALGKTQADRILTNTEQLTELGKQMALDKFERLLDAQEASLKKYIGDNLSESLRRMSEDLKEDILKQIFRNSAGNASSITVEDEAEDETEDIDVFASADINPFRSASTDPDTYEDLIRDFAREIEVWPIRSLYKNGSDSLVAEISEFYGKDVGKEMVSLCREIPKASLQNEEALVEYFLSNSPLAPEEVICL